MVLTRIVRMECFENYTLIGINKSTLAYDRTQNNNNNKNCWNSECLIGISQWKRPWQFTICLSAVAFDGDVIGSGGVVGFDETNDDYVRRELQKQFNSFFSFEFLGFIMIGPLANAIYTQLNEKYSKSFDSGEIHSCNSRKITIFSLSLLNKWFFISQLILSAFIWVHGRMTITKCAQITYRRNIKSDELWKKAHWIEWKPHQHK